MVKTNQSTSKSHWGLKTDPRILEPMEHLGLLSQKVPSTPRDYPLHTITKSCCMPVNHVVN